ncbi:MAG: winged helix-turn-helix transcriptional regulator [Oscillospiraceae bacterium]|nr:winged helix-turn-helix transcriptional regulator [Oscillospiraceae bacterium]MBP1574207.1 winged helix-turn-helix transcriptional regulator [Oscillospiraceae bacterium]MBQ5322693.1 winged helix-turn-helix transcriptional regulator [Oscillospiraceae bacterium]MBQ8595825.1 winged helix-turn-helix transcriptional regulator [Oscillospiraceae bacterium]
MCERYYINTELRILSRNINNYFINYGNNKKVDKMTGSGAWIIAYIAENGYRDVFQRDLEKEFDITRSTASKNVDLLVENGFIVRTPVDYDARLKKLVLTEKAKEVFKIMRSDRATLEEQMLRGFSDEEKKQLRGFLKRLASNLDTEEDL